MPTAWRVVATTCSWLPRIGNAWMISPKKLAADLTQFSRFAWTESFHLPPLVNNPPPPFPNSELQKSLAFFILWASTAPSLSGAEPARHIDVRAGGVSTKC